MRLVRRCVYAPSSHPVAEHCDRANTCRHRSRAWLGGQVKIIVKLAGMTPEEMETRVTTPIEIEMLGLPKQTMLRSTSKYGLTDITIDFEDGTDIYWARNQVSERLTGIMGDLPPGLTGGLAPITTPLGEMFMFTVEGDLSLAERRGLLDWVIRPALRTVRGVADVNVLGGLASAYEVVPDPARLAATGITLDELRTTLNASTGTTVQAASMKAKRRCWCGCRDV
jgi:cobalt-zinc-cadmium resistance protein CzcA